MPQNKKARRGGGSIDKTPMLGYTDSIKGHCDKRLTL